MKFLRWQLNWIAPVLALLIFYSAVSSAQVPAHPAPAASRPKPAATPMRKSYSAAQVESGKSLFQQNCSFCHGRDAGGGESGPDLTRSKLVTEDIVGNRIGAVVRSGRPKSGMPAFEFSDAEIAALAAFIHTRQNAALADKGGRRGVDPADLRSGNPAAGERYFNGAGGCATCHSPTGDLAGIASQYQGLKLEERMLYPKHAKSRVTVTIASGPTMIGTLEYLDEFTVGLFDAEGSYRSFRIADVQYKVDASQNAHVDLLSKYSDEDIHNLMAYLQTLR